MRKIAVVTGAAGSHEIWYNVKTRRFTTVP